MKGSSPVRLFITVALVAGLSAAGAMMFWPGPERDLRPEEMVGTVLPQARALPEVTLVDHEGDTWTPADLDGRWHYLFFGFTHCPDVCPMTLATLAGAMQELESDGMDEMPAVVFVTVDPQRDTPAAMANYVEHFHDDFVGVTGARGEIDRLTQSLGISYTLHEPDENGDYAVDHSAAILLIDPQGRLRALWQPPHGRDVLAEEYQRIQQRFPSA
ncbi:SCO family protein [Spiribacter onubensis]|uniref:SCO family protein n=1 Tax=Spiribacter onubensis TaxID=3122420 RepID=A0ABV3S639_9GAMM